MASVNRQGGNIDEKTINWLDKNRDAFGKKILCAGVGTRTAQHISHQVPDSLVVFLTSEGQEVKKAPDGLNEPLTVKADPADYEGGLFDTVVFCPAETLDLPEHGKDGVSFPDKSPHLIHGGRDFPRPERGALYLSRAAVLMNYYEHAAEVLCRHLQRGGTLLTLVRSEHDEHLLGFCLALAAQEMEVDARMIRQILCREGDKRVVLQGIRARAGGRTDIGVLIAENLNFSLDRMNTAADELQGHDAEILLQADISQLLRGYHIYRDNRLMGKLCVYDSLQRPDVLYYFTDVEGDTPYLKRFHTQDRDKIIRHMVGELHRQKAVDKSVSWRELKLNDDWSETEI